MDRSKLGLLTIDEALRYMDISHAQLYRLFNQGQLPQVKLSGVGGQRTYVSKDSIDGFIDKRIAEAREKAVERKTLIPISTPTMVNPYGGDHDDDDQEA